MEIGTVRQVDIDSEMRAAYLDYAMSVIVSRALPDARDGLKPVHRRILYAMYDMGMRPDAAYRKSARIVGEVLGKYHPHGDAAVYDAMVRLAQDFAMRYPLVDGQGNFGSIDGDAAAAMRYTEARMQALGSDMLRDIDMETVDFAGNFDDSLSEPTVLPSSFPNLIVNGSSGIAVGMSTSIPPHNLAETCDALVYMLNHWENLDDIGLPDLMQFIKGPDFPTGGLLFRNSEDGSDNLAQAYATGRGKLVVQAKAHIEQLSRARNRLIITELPYQINKTSLLERIAELVRDNRIEGITDLRDESDRTGLRIVIDMTRNVEPSDVLRALYRLTPMRTTFSVIMLALVDNEPRLLTLKQALRVYLEHRFEVVRRRSEYELERARERAHILQGLLIALGHLDEVIKLIRNSASAEAANQALQQTYNLSEVQATAILNMPLRRLAALERRKIEEEYADLVNRIAYLEELLNSPELIRGVVRDELTEIRSHYSDPRRTLIVDAAAGSALSVAELIPEEQLWVTVTESGLVSRTFTDEAPRITAQTRDAPVSMLFAGSGDTLLVFSADGYAATVPVHQLPQSDDPAGGTHFGDVSGMRRDARIVAAVTMSSALSQGYLTLASLDGMVKRIELDELPGISANAFPVMGLDNDELGWALWTYGGQELVMISAQGKAIRFNEDEIRPMGLRAGGVKGMKIEEQGDRIIGFSLYAPDAFVWTMTEAGQVKRSPASDYPLQGRYGQGVITYKLAGKGDPGLLGAAVVAGPDDQVVAVTSKGKARAFKLSGTPLQGRNTSGVSAMPLGNTETVARALLISKRINSPAGELPQPEAESESAGDSPEPAEEP